MGLFNSICWDDDNDDDDDVAVAEGFRVGESAFFIRGDKHGDSGLYSLCDSDDCGGGGSGTSPFPLLLYPNSPSRYDDGGDTPAPMSPLPFERSRSDWGCGAGPLAGEFASDDPGDDVEGCCCCCWSYESSVFWR